MNLAEIAANIPSTGRTNVGAIERIRARLTDKDRDFFDACLADADLWPAARIELLLRAMAEDGKIPTELLCTYQTVSRYRRLGR